jgi:hypothetical protein
VEKVYVWMCGKAAISHTAARLEALAANLDPPKTVELKQAPSGIEKQDEDDEVETSIRSNRYLQYRLPA